MAKILRAEKLGVVGYQVPQRVHILYHYGINLPFCRVPIFSILGFILRTYQNVRFGSLTLSVHILYHYGIRP